VLPTTVGGLHGEKVRAFRLDMVILFESDRGQAIADIGQVGMAGREDLLKDP
jgi:hypothetical protein